MKVLNLKVIMMGTDIIIGIHPDKTGDESYSNKWIKYLQEKDVEVRILDLLAPDAIEQSSQCDGIMWRWLHNPTHKQSAKTILYTIENYLGIPVFPNSSTSWHYDEKVSEFYLLQALEAPVAQTWVFWNRNQAIEWAKKAQYPLVWKLSSGAGSANVLKLTNQKEAVNLINRTFTRGIFPYTMNEFKMKRIPRSLNQANRMLNCIVDSLRYFWNADYPKLHPVWWKPEYGYAYFQEFLPDNTYDTRITIIGDRAFGFRRMNRPNDFRASGSGNIDTNSELIDKRCIEMAFEISKKAKFQSMSYDFLYKSNEPVICEISYTFTDAAVYSCPGHWNSNLNWIEGQMWPEEAQVDDFLKSVSENKKR